MINFFLCRQSARDEYPQTNFQLNMICLRLELIHLSGISWCNYLWFLSCSKTQSIKLIILGNYRKGNVLLHTYIQQLLYTEVCGNKKKGICV